MTMRAIENLADLRTLAKHDPRYLQLATLALANLGCEHLGDGDPVRGLEQYAMSLECEYGMDDAEASTVEEINFFISWLVEADFGPDDIGLIPPTPSRL